jgi:hypothetical protein
MSPQECTLIDKHLTITYQYRMKYMPSNAKHSIFISVKEGGIGVRSFTREYMGALRRDIEVYISQANSLTAHALISSIEEASKQVLWNLYQKEKIPSGTSAAYRANLLSISGKKTLVYQDNIESSPIEQISYDHTHTMEKVVKSTCKLGFMLRDLNDELGSRFIDELLILDRNAKELASPLITTRHSSGASLGAGNDTFVKYSMLGHTYILLQVVLEEAKKSALVTNTNSTNANLEDILTKTSIYRRLNCFTNKFQLTD